MKKLIIIIIFTFYSATLLLADKQFIKFSTNQQKNSNVFIGKKQDKKLGGINISGESCCKVHDTSLKGKAKDIEFEKEWFWFGYKDEGELLRRANIYHNLRLFLTAGVMNRYLLNAELGISKFNTGWNYEKRDPISQFDYLSGDEAFWISLETVQNNPCDVKNKVTIGRIYPQYTSYTFKKRHNGVMLETEFGNSKITATGSRLKKFNDTSQYLVSARGETMLAPFKLGTSCVLSRYDVKSVAAGKDSLYGSRNNTAPAIFIKISDKTPHDYWGAKLWHVTVKKISYVTNHYTQFKPGNSAEAQYLFDIHGNVYLDGGAQMRRADENGYFIYRFPLSEEIEQLQLDLDISQDYKIEISYDGINFQVVSEGDKDDSNRRIETILVPLLPKITTPVYAEVTISDDSPGDGWGGDLYKLEYYENGQLKISFSPDTASGSMEQQYLSQEYKSSYASGHRYADGDAYFTYRIPVSMDLNKIKFILDIQHDYKITVKIGTLQRVVRASGNVQNDSNRKLEVIEFNSYDDLYKNTYIQSGSTIIGFDLSMKLMDTELKAEFARSIEHRVYPGGRRKNKAYNAWYFQIKRPFKFIQSELYSEYFYIDPFYNASVSVEDNDDNDELIDELEPYEVSYPRLEYDPFKDRDNNNINDEDEADTEPDYFYKVNQKGYKIQTITKLSKGLTGTLFFSEIMEISTKKIGQTSGCKLDLYKEVIKNTSLIWKYQVFYYKDNRYVSSNPNNLKNYFKTIFYYQIKPFDVGMGIERLWINRNLKEKNTNLDSEFVVKSRYHIYPFTDFLIRPLFQIIFTRKMWIDPAYDLYEEWNQYIPGILFEYQLAKKAKVYINYRYVYTYDIKWTVNHNVYSLFEIGTESYGSVNLRIFYRFVDHYYVRKEMQEHNWKSGNLFGEVRFWF